MIVSITVRVAKLLTRGKHHSEGWFSLISNSDSVLVTRRHVKRDEVRDKLIQDLVEPVSLSCLTRSGPATQIQRLFTTPPML